jgi:hypothetical protein
MAEVYVTLVALQPLMASRSTARASQQNRPQATGNVRGGNLYEARAKKRLLRGAQKIKVK